ncbi:N-acetylmuramoyl-L-alanine amidase [Arthrobacter sp. GCM10027362]|uniref:N-acetylmuramoyl-L-alanine amidase n=1 Tax=Arthrobacter sp. GCM10027362 TaxID=3273379 RepID=UPI00362B966B
MMLTNLADVLRTGGAKVEEYQGWKTRGYTDGNGNRWELTEIRGSLWHHTATPSARYSTGAPTLRMCVDGRPDLAGPLCQIVLGRDGTAHVIAAGWANHAGHGSYPGIPRNRGNAYLVGIEMESSGLPPYDWTPAQLAAIPVIAAALRKGYGHTLDIAHYEYSSMGKTDPAGLPGGMTWLRRAAAQIMTTAST